MLKPFWKSWSFVEFWFVYIYIWSGTSFVKSRVERESKLWWEVSFRNTGEIEVVVEDHRPEILMALHEQGMSIVFGIIRHSIAMHRHGSILVPWHRSITARLRLIVLSRRVRDNRGIWIISIRGSQIIIRHSNRLVSSFVILSCCFLLTGCQFRVSGTKIW